MAGPVGRWCCPVRPGRGSPGGRGRIDQLGRLAVLQPGALLPNDPWHRRRGHVVGLRTVLLVLAHGGPVAERKTPPDKSPANPQVDLG